MAITNTISYDLLLLIAGGGRLIAIADSLMSPPCTSLQGVVEHVPYKLLGTVMDYGLGMMPVILSLIPPLQTVGHGDGLRSGHDARHFVFDTPPTNCWGLSGKHCPPTH